MRLGEITRKAYIDTGASVTLIANTILQSKHYTNLKKYYGRVHDASGNTINIIGEINTDIRTPVGNFNTRVLIYVKTTSVDYDILLGMNILRNTCIDFGSRELTFSLDKPHGKAQKYGPYKASALEIDVLSRADLLGRLDKY